MDWEDLFKRLFNSYLEESGGESGTDCCPSKDWSKKTCKIIDGHCDKCWTLWCTHNTSILD